MTSCEECQKPLGTSPDGGAWCVNEKCSRVYRAADPTPPAAPRPCGCGHARSDHEELEADGLEVCAGDNESCRCMEYRPVSPEAARCPALWYSCQCSLPDYHDGRHQFKCPPAEAAPPRATTPEAIAECFCTRDSICAYHMVVQEADALRAENDRLRDKNNRLALESITVAARQHLASPSRESGALLDELQQRIIECAVNALSNELRNWRAFDAKVLDARAALDRHLSTLERDAARKRTDVQRAFETADALANALTQDSDSGDFGRALADRAHTACKLFGQLARIRAALSPSGEPTATPET
jgi:hypothetical protein